MIGVIEVQPARYVRKHLERNSELCGQSCGLNGERMWRFQATKLICRENWTSRGCMRRETTI